MIAAGHQEPVAHIKRVKKRMIGSAPAGEETEALPIRVDSDRNVEGSQPRDVARKRPGHLSRRGKGEPSSGSRSCLQGNFSGG